MNKIFFILCILLAIPGIGYSQVIPKGMNYQAVARNIKGEVIANEKVAFKIYLFSNEGNKRIYHFSEVHEVTTGRMGLFNLIIGEGVVEQGAFGLIPWNAENIWMEVALKDKGKKEFFSLSNSKLQAVPYAIHAAFTNRILDTPKNTSNPGVAPAAGVESLNWSVFGNENTDDAGNPYHINALGTTDLVDLIMITDNKERLRILSNGNIITKLNFEIGKDLNVLGNAAIQQTLLVSDSLIVMKNALFNTQGGSTINYGPFTVINQSPTLLSGELIVDHATVLNSTLIVHGPTDLNSRLFVNNMSPTKFTGTLQVDKITDLNDALHVNTMSPTHLTGTLRVDKATNLNDSLTVNTMSPTHLTGTLRIDKATNLNDSLTINNMSPTVLTGTLTVDKEALFNKNVLLTDTTESLSTMDGALVVNGGLGLVGNLNVGGSTAFGGPVGFASPVSITDATQSTSTTTGALKVTGGTGIGKNLNVGGTTSIAGMTSVTDGTQSTSTTTGALKVTGGTGIGKNLNVGGSTSVAGMTTVTDGTQSTSTTTGALKVTGGTGIGLQLNVGGMTSILDNTQSTSTITGALKVTGGMGIGLQLNVGGMTSILDMTQSTSAGTGALKVTGGTGIGLQLNVGGMTSILDTTQSTSSTSGSLKVTGGSGIVKNLYTGGAMTISGVTTLNNGLNLNGAFSVTSSNSFISNFINTSGANGISIKIANSTPEWANNFVEFRNSSSGVVGRIEGETASQSLSNPEYIRKLDVLNVDLTFAEVAVGTASAYVVSAAAGLVGALASSTVCAGLGVCGTLPIASLIVKAIADVTARGIGVGKAVERRDAAEARRDEYIAYKAARVGVTYESGSGDYAEWLPKADPEENFLPGYIVGMKGGQITKQIEKGSKVMVISTQPIVLGNMQDNENKGAYEKVAFMGQVPVQVLGKVNAGDYILPSGNGDGLGRAVPVSKMQVEDYGRIVGVAWSASENETYNLINVAIGLNDGDISKVVIEQKNKFNELRSKYEQSNLILARLIPGYKEAARLNETEMLTRQVSGTDPASFIREFQLPVTNTSKRNYMEVSKEEIIKFLNTAENSIIEAGGNPDNYLFWKLMHTEPGYKEYCVKTIQGVYKKVVQVQFEKLNYRK